MSPPAIRPQPLVRIPEPFNDPDWLFELNLDDFRALAHIEQGQCRLVSRHGHSYSSFERLKVALVRELKIKDAILDGEIVCLDGEGKSLFNLLFRRGNPIFASCR